MTKPLVRSDSFGFLLSDTARMLRRRFDQKARALGQTRAQWQALAYLARNEGINQAGLADLLDMEGISLCRLLDRMEEGGWVTRTVDPNDRRAKLIHMTDKAHGIFVEMQKTADQIYAEALSGLPKETRDELIKTLSHVRANLSGQ
jgi:DNA-binding MarR family transcriptional regulator